MSKEANDGLVSIDVTKDFKYAYRGCNVHAYDAGKRYDVPAECADLAIKEKWAKKAKGDAPQNATPAAPQSAAVNAAPTNASVAIAPANADAVSPDENKGA